MTALYLYPLWLRIWHWTNAALFLVLLATGLSMHYSNAGWLLPFEVAVPVHNAAGILLTLSWVVFVAGNLFGDNGRHYRVQLSDLTGRLWQQVRFYGYGIFVDAPHPFQVSVDMKLNPLQKLSYLGAMALLMPLLILSGWSFLFAPHLPETLFGIGTIWIVAMVHLTVSWLLALFLLVHLYIITTGDTLWSNLRAMLTGWHRDE